MQRSRVAATWLCEVSRQPCGWFSTLQGKTGAGGGDHEPGEGRPTADPDTQKIKNK